MAGDVGSDGLGLDEAGRALLASCDVVIHSAATVAFDSPLDAAVEINLLGPTRDRGDAPRLGVAPHLVAVSHLLRRRQPPRRSARAAASRRPLLHRTSTGGPRSTPPVGHAADAEAESRTPARLAEFRSRPATSSARPAPPRSPPRPRAAARHGSSPAWSKPAAPAPPALGWPDAYAYTKALGEQALTDDAPGDIPVTIVRPSIIESALAEPVPGWIRGFRMAEPVILSYARGLLSSSPACPRASIDVIPVDLVVGAIIAVAARRPGRRAAPIVQVASRRSQPAALPAPRRPGAGLVHRAPPLRPEGQPIVVPEFSSPAGAGSRASSPGEGAAHASRARLQSLPLRGKQADLAARIEEKREDVERAFTYVELYGKYVECEAVYGVDRLLALDDGVHRRGPRRRSTSTRASSTGQLRPRDPPPVRRAARSGADDTRRLQRRTRALRLRRPGARPGPSRRRVRLGEHAHRVERRRDLLVAGDPAAAAPTNASASSLAPWLRRPGC